MVRAAHNATTVSVPEKHRYSLFLKLRSAHLDVHLPSLDLLIKQINIFYVSQTRFFLLRVSAVFVSFRSSHLSHSTAFQSMMGTGGAPWRRKKSSLALYPCLDSMKLQEISSRRYHHFFNEHSILGSHYERQTTKRNDHRIAVGFLRRFDRPQICHQMKINFHPNGISLSMIVTANFVEFQFQSIGGFFIVSNACNWTLCTSFSTPNGHFLVRILKSQRRVAFLEFPEKLQQHNKRLSAMWK